ncbi:MAG: endonuclease domain-containing protein [Jatrophihabitans sp.]|uniref:endonuclease domain-containing protein n=1 Tax=Jatrophihabitans sp. TaxID=1932789 RepID=UPI00391128DA
MRSEVDRLLAACGGVASRAALLTVQTRNQLDDEIARRHLIAPFPRAYCRPWDAEVQSTLDRAGLVSVGPPVALSHLSALRRWDLPVPDALPVHVTVPFERHPIGRTPGLVVHRTRVPTPVRLLDGLRIVAPAVAVVRSWPLLPSSTRRAPAIEAVRRKLVTPADLRGAASHTVGMPGRAQLGRLIDALDSGCESELELWGFLHVFDAPGLRHGQRQKIVQVRGRTFRLDLAYDDERVAVELDGYRYHSGRDQRERDMRRDAALASIGWLTLRFSYERLHHDVAGCRRDTLTTLAARRNR